MAELFARRFRAPRAQATGHLGAGALRAAAPRIRRGLYIAALAGRTFRLGAGQRQQRFSCPALPGDEGKRVEEEEAMLEAMETLAEAQEAAREQTIRELIQMEKAAGVRAEEVAGKGPGAPSSFLPAVVLGHGSGASFPGAVRALQKSLIARGFTFSEESGYFGRQTEAALKRFQASEGLPQSGVLDAATLEAVTRYDREEAARQGTAANREHADRLRHFWREEGLSDERQIERLVEALAATSSTGSMEDVDVLYAKLQRLRRLLPEVDVVRMAIKEPRVLEMDLTLATGNLIMLLEALPGQDISAAVAEFPRALMMRDLRERLDVTLGRLTEWSHASIVHAVLGDNLHFLQRVPDYYTETIYGELPIDIQNSMTVGGGGGGTYFKSWSGFVDNNTD